MTVILDQEYNTLRLNAILDSECNLRQILVNIEYKEIRKLHLQWIYSDQYLEDLGRTKTGR